MTQNERNLPQLLRDAERRVNAHVFKTGSDDALASIPANRDRDVDLLLMEAAAEIERLQRLQVETAAMRIEHRCPSCNANLLTEGPVVATNGGIKLTCVNCGHEPCAEWCGAEKTGELLPLPPGVKSRSEFRRYTHQPHLFQEYVGFCKLCGQLSDAAIHAVTTVPRKGDV